MTEYCTDREITGKLFDALFVESYMSENLDYVALDMHNIRSEYSKVLIKHEQMLSDYDFLGEQIEKEMPVSEDVAGNFQTGDKNPNTILSYFKMTDTAKQFASLEMREVFIDYITFKEKLKQELEEVQRAQDAAPAYKIALIAGGFTLGGAVLGSLISVVLAINEPKISIVPAPVLMTPEQYITFQSCMDTESDPKKCLMVDIELFDIEDSSAEKSLATEIDTHHR